MKRTFLVGAVAAAFGLLAACSPGSQDFQEEGEKFIEDSDGDVATQTEHTFEDASCEKPSDTDTGTTYECTALDEDGDEWSFTVEITGKRELTVQSAFSRKLYTEQLLPSLEDSLGDIDDACFEGVIDGHSDSELEAIFDDPNGTDANALVEEIVTACAPAA